MRAGARPALVLLVATVLGAAVGVGAMFSVDPGPGRDPVAASRPLPRVPQPSPASVPSVPEGLLLAWTPNGLPPGLGTQVAGLGGVDHVAAVRGDRVDLVASYDAEGRPVDQPAAGLAIPLDAMGFDPATHTAFVPPGDGATFVDLAADEALLGATSAELRGLGPGASLTLAGGRSFRVAGVVDDALVGAAELVLNLEGATAAGVSTERYLLVAYEAGKAERAEIEAGIRSLVPAEVPVQFRGPGETPFLRSSDAVLPQALIKERFGEFAYRMRGSGPDPRALDLDPGWASDQLVTAELPVLGLVRCHRSLLPALEGAMAELLQRNLGFLVAANDGCWNPRLIRPGAGISRHSWGAAIDLNYAENATGLDPYQDGRLVEVMARWGFTWGGEWLVPDAAHFEYVRPPSG